MFGEILAIEDWNTRPVEDALRSENARLRHIIEDAAIELLGDDYCPDIEAYSDGHCSLVELVKTQRR